MSEEILKRENSFCIISTDVYGDNAVRDIQTNTGWHKNPYDSGYVVVPDNMVLDILETKGYCDIVLNDDNTEVVSFTAREIPEVNEVENEPTEYEKLRADVDYIAVMTGVAL